jgi:hypothetical protein
MKDEIATSAVRALSLSRPWDQLVLAGVKDVENRTWGTRLRGPLIIHAAKSWDPNCVLLLRDLARDGVLTPDDFAAIDGCDLSERAPTGFRGVVTVTDCHEWGTLACVDLRTEAYTEPCSPWAFDGQHHWVVTDPRLFPEVIAGRGFPGLFTPPDEVVAAVAALAVPS